MLDPIEVHTLKVAFFNACRTRAEILSILNSDHREKHGENWDFTKDAFFMPIRLESPAVGRDSDTTI